MKIYVVNTPYLNTFRDFMKKEGMAEMVSGVLINHLLPNTFGTDGERYWLMGNDTAAWMIKQGVEVDHTFNQ